MLYKFPPVPVHPTDLTVTKKDKVLEFNWNQPHGIGPQYFVEGFVFRLSSAQTSRTTLLDKDTLSLSINDSFEYNVNITATLSSFNCVGESSLVLLLLFFGTRNHLFKTRHA